MKRTTRLPDYDSPAFEKQFHYPGHDLGVRCSPQASAFRIWAPTAQSVDLLLFRTGHKPEQPRIIPMAQGANGTWTATVAEDLRNLYYRFRLVQPGLPAPVEAIDPYAVAAGANGERAMIVDLRDRIQLIARSTTTFIDVSHIAEVFGGGGHARAAAALIRHQTLAEVKARLIDVLGAHVRPPMTVRQIIADPEGNHDWALHAWVDLDECDEAGDLIVHTTDFSRQD